MNIYPWLRTDITTKYGVFAVSEMLTRRVSATIKYAQVKQCFDTRFVFVAKQ
jgi:hypothetical protein